MSKPPKPPPHGVDVHVGRRLRIRRRQRGVSQGALAEKLGLTFQQMQKYERASNRISASKLYAVACALGAPVSYFFEGLPGPDVPNPPTALCDQLMAADGGPEIVECFQRLQSPEVRRALVSLVSAMVEDEENKA